MNEDGRTKRVWTTAGISGGCLRMVTFAFFVRVLYGKRGGPPLRFSGEILIARGQSQ